MKARRKERHKWRRKEVKIEGRKQREGRKQ
jgi:hypothetical protein